MSQVETAPSAGVMPRGWFPAGLAYALGLCGAGAVAYFVFHIPVQVSDCLGNIIAVRELSYRELFVGQLFAGAYTRPMTWLQIKLAVDLAGGHYWLMFKAIHAAQLVALAVMFVHLLRVRSLAALALVPVALAVLFGLHTFNGLVREAYPVNGYLTIVVAVVAAICLSLARPRLINDLLAVLLFVFALLSVESGLLVLVALFAGWLAGFRGVSRWALLACVVVTVGYLYLRLGPFGVGTPPLGSRSSGFGFRVLDPPEIVARFGEQPLYFYAYNIVSSVLTVLLSEPKAGVWVLVDRLYTHDDVPPWLVVNVAASVTALVLVVWYGCQALGRWRRRQASEDDRLAFVALGVFAANAVLCYGYTKSVMMSPGGVCAAFLLFLALRNLSFSAVGMRWPARACLIALVACTAVGWTVRASGLPVLLRDRAFSIRSDWAAVYPWLASQGISVSSPATRALVDQLRTEALSTPVPNAETASQAHREYFDLD